MPRPPWRLIPFEQAREIIARQVRPGQTDRVPLAEAHGRVLAEPVHAQRDYPAFDKAMMDGFALRAADPSAVAPAAASAKPPAAATTHAGLERVVVGEVAAGREPVRPLGPGEAIRINTGAPLPPGADAVVPIERTTPGSGPDRIRLAQPVEAGQHVARRGADARAGELVLPAGVRLGAPQLAAAVAAGCNQITSFRTPRVAIVSTGDELVAPGEPATGGRIFDSNGPCLAALTQDCAGEAVPLGIVRDDAAALRARFSEALREPVVVAVGGMSMGTLDLVPEVLAELGVRWQFHGVDMRPGKPVAYGVGPAGQHVFGLPGNPVSAYVCFLTLVRAALDGLLGQPPRPLASCRAQLETSIRASRDPRPAFLPALLTLGKPQGPTAALVEWHGSGDPFGLARANALILQPNGQLALDPGAWVDVLPAPGWAG